MPSLLEAIEAKYSQSTTDENVEPENSCDEVQFVIFVPKSDPRKRLQRVLVLDKCEIDSAGDEKILESALCELQELDLSHNNLTKWSDVWKMVRCAPRLTFLNLSFNNLSSTEFLDGSKLTGATLSQLSVLILIGTNVSWKSVHFILSRVKNLKELYLSKNELSHVDPMDSETSKEESYPQLSKLAFDENEINSWDEIQKLGRLFPSLVHLSLADCPISSIPETAGNYFTKLESFTASNALLKEMSDIANFRCIPRLTDLRIQGTFVFTELTAHERRQLFIALLPNIKRLNGGAIISSDERECSERAYIRHFLDREDPKPKRYYELIAIHGELHRLVDVELKPKTRVKIRFIFDEIITEQDIPVYQSVKELKIFLEKIIGIRPSRMRLFYNDIGLNEGLGHEEMKFPEKQLYSYNFRDGDEIYVYVKGKAVPNQNSSRRGFEFETIPE